MSRPTFLNKTPNAAGKCVSVEVGALQGKENGVFRAVARIGSDSAVLAKEVIYLFSGNRFHDRCFI